MSRDIKCFVIMPFSKTTPQHTEEYWTTLFSSFLKPLIEEHPQVEAFRSSVRREDLLSEILKNLVIQPIVVADLTDYNPNVFWELGIRQSFKNGTITIAENGTSLPFDLSKKGTLFYHHEMLKNETFRRQFREAISDCVNTPQRPDSLVLETIGGRGSIFEVIRRDEVSRRLKSLEAEAKSNAALLNRVIKLAKNNIDIRTRLEKKETVSEKLLFQTGRFRFSCIELLISNRYLDAKDNFYASAETYHDYLLALNDQLQICETKPSETEGYIIKMADTFKTVFKTFSENLSSISKSSSN